MNKDVTWYPEEGVRRAMDEFETPFFLYDEERLRENCSRFRDAFREHFPDFQPLFAVKTNCNPSVLKVIASEEFEFDCSSPYEAWMADKLGVDGMYTGAFTPGDELKFASDRGMILNLDDVSILDLMEEVPEVISFRINPGVSGSTQESLLVAGPDAKFGLPFEKAAAAYQRALDMGVKRFGIHMMTGSNILDEEYFAMIVGKLMDIVAELPVEIEFMNIGGGFGVPYAPDEKSLDLSVVARGVREVMTSKCSSLGVREPRLMAEPGRIIAADMGFLVSRVCVMKDGYKKFVGVDASSNDMPRPSIYGAYHHISVLDECADRELVSVVGRICENNDQFVRDRELPVMKIGDVVVLHNCGGHAFVMGHNYNGRCRHAEYLLGLDGSLKCIREAETFEDLSRGCK